MRFNEHLFALVKSAGVVARMMQPGIFNDKKGMIKDENETDAHYAMRQAKTKVDDMVQEMLLQGVYPWLANDVFLDVEEDTKMIASYPNKEAEYGIIIDPIDGTLPYIQQSDEYSICVGISYKHDFVCAMVYFAAKDELYYYGKDSGARYYQNASIKTFDDFLPLSVTKSKGSKIIVKNSRVAEKVLEPFQQAGYTIIDDSSEGWNCPKAILQCMQGEINAYLCDHRNLRDILLAVIYSHCKDVSCLAFDGKKVSWQPSGRQESVFLSTDIDTINIIKK